MAQDGRFAEERWFSARHLFICALFSFAAGLAVASFAGFRDFLPGLLEGAWVTIQITVAAAALAVVCGLLAGLAKMSPLGPLRWFAIAYIELFRGTSALVQLFWLFFVLPHFDITLDPTLRTVEIFLLVLVIYLGIALVITFFMRALERYTRRSAGMVRT